MSAADRTSCIPVASRLEGWYDFDGRASPTQGVAGFGPDAVWFGNPAPVEGRAGGALHFENGSYLEIASHEFFNYPTQNFTISGWMRTTSTATVFLDKRCPAGAAGCGATTQGWALGISPGGYLQMLMASASPYFYEGFAAYSLRNINDGEWHFVAASVDRATQQLRLVVDQAEPQLISLEGYRGPIPSARPLRFGSDHGPGAKFVGDLDEVQIHGRALEPAELANISRAGAGGQCRPPACSPLSTASSIVAWYTFDETSGQIWSDRVGQNYYLSGSAGRGAGQSGGAVSFETTAAGAGLQSSSSSPELALGDRDLTLSTWIRYAPGGDGRRAILDVPGSYTLLLENGGARLELAPSLAWTAGPRVDDGQWHHLAVVIDRTSATPGTATSFYLDGEASPAIPANPTIGAPPANPGVLHVGAFAGEPSATQGLVDELAIFRAALPPEAIRSIAAAAASTFCRRNDQGCVAPPPGLVSWYRFEQMEGALDDAGQAPNEPLLLSSSSLRAPGRVGAGLRLREPGGFARTLSATAKLNFSSAFTLSVWIRPTSTTGARTILEKMTLPAEGYRLRLIEGRVELTLGAQTWTSTSTLTLEQWSHLAVSATPRAIPALLINGAREPLSGAPWLGRASSGNRLLLGASADPVLNAAERAGFDLDELSFYDRALAEAEVQALAIAGQCPSSDVPPTRPVFEVRTQPENIGVSVGIGGESPAVNSYATSTPPARVTATPTTVSSGTGTEYRFRNWSLNGTPDLAWTSLVQAVPLRESSATYTANYDTFHRLTVNIVGSCTVTPSAGFYLLGTDLPLGVTLPAGTTLSATFGLGNLAEPVANGTRLTISAPATLEVNCRSTVVAVIVGTSPAEVGLAVIADGTPVSGARTFNWATGITRNLSVPAPIQAMGGTQYTFRRWRNLATETTVGTTPSIQVTPNGPAQYVAEFERTGYAVELRPTAGCPIVASPGPPASGYYAPGTFISFRLEPASGTPLTLTVTSGSAAPPRTSTSPLEYTILNPVIVSGQCQVEETFVTFRSNPPSVTQLGISFQPAGGGSPLSIQQHYAPTLRFRTPGTLTLTAAPTATDFTGIHRFTDIIPGNYQSGATFPAPAGIATYLARYELICYLVTPQGSPSGSGSASVSFVSGPQPYSSNCFSAGSILTLTARPNPGYAFDVWWGVEPASSANPLTYRVPNTVAIPTARFRRIN